ncbi:chromosomal replication initiator protein DnaA [Thermosipho melanesiensis]|uniref:Chromosomal replication initiator protein DnaA n=2 Tax=Thermosipho melanesiensis TaxID=46541 RepID=DNAA_THEM4|nr:chromosomal replication initiator protein DnaA [Thermosipho melanesiensis]A6LIY2.1 RecName: Full=Chromosomal replication initiator protein DnaA [Thermosipho melanesiensis BI429]ABR29883.1 chromosomal replication initiator protein DnaA [Thermosipho melanesiensis BI429]APT73094.1 chromosomal replication initiation protein [Thermosipho melanesiensis]OOC38484.1 chromosomal replication initiator protein DnaA [Thermosipho melanesiensis]OOC40288.1 chromosomal replication initiator protein DnaA [Th
MKNKIIASLKERISRQNWENWFLDFNIRELKDNHVVFEVGNFFIKERLEKKFNKIISKVVKDILGKDATYEITFKEIPYETKVESGPLIKKRPLLITPLNPKYTFENLVVGEFNKFAYNVFLEASKNPGFYNPIFLYSGVGLGKTHLAQALGNYLLETDPDMKVAYLTSEEFMNEMFSAIKNGNIDEFREKYRKKADILIIDDIQFLIGIKSAQTELFHTFNTIHEAGKQIIICSDRTPQELKDFHSRMISRFQMGLLVKIEKPSSEDLFKIGKKISEMKNVEIDDEIIKYISKIYDNPRLIHGAILRLIAYRNLYGTLNLSIAESILTNVSKPPKSFEEKLLEILSEIFDCSPDDITSSKRTKNISYARKIGMYFAVKKLNLSTRDVGTIFKKSHSSVVQNVKQVEKLLKEGNVILKNYLKQIDKMSKGFAQGESM